MKNYLIGSVRPSIKIYNPWAGQGQDVRYAIDDSKLKQLGWQAKADFDQELASVVEYYRNNFVW